MQASSHAHLGISALVDELLDGLQAGVAKSNEGLNALEQTGGGLVHLHIVQSYCDTAAPPPFWMTGPL